MGQNTSQLPPTFCDLSFTDYFKFDYTHPQNSTICTLPLSLPYLHVNNDTLIQPNISLVSRHHDNSMSVKPSSKDVSRR